jgi:hypothetical protein
LAEYSYEVVYKPGVSNTNADALSRIREVMIVRIRSQTSQQNNNMTLISFEDYMKDKTCQNVMNSDIQEVLGDIFKVPEEIYLIHCVSGDLKLS